MYKINAMEEELEIKLQVGGTYYPIRIKRSEEYMYREAARRINNMLSRYRGKFPQLSNEKYYTMVTIHIAMANIMWENFNDTLPYVDKIQKLTDELESFLVDNTASELPD